MDKCQFSSISQQEPYNILENKGQFIKTRLLSRPQPQMYPPVALNQYTWVNRTHKHFLYMLQGPMKILK